MKSNLEKIADALATNTTAEPAMTPMVDHDDNSFHSHTFRKHNGKYYVYKGHYKPVGEGYNSYSEMLPEYLKAMKK
jgi:hypothetical protein